MDDRMRADHFQRLLADAGHPLAKSSVILDFGCGKGGLVRAFSEAGFNAFGCDFAFEMSEQTDQMRALDESPYRIPFDDDSFDCVVSDQVFEHIQDYSAALREVRRVLYPGGASLNLFPPRYSLREPHIFVPFATVMQSRLWLSLWARLGIRNDFQQGKNSREVKNLNAAFLADHTTYYGRRELLTHAREIFPDARLLELETLATRPGRRARQLYALARHAPVLARIWSETRGRTLLLT
jgi:SAM-dependent methyltransferase